MATPSLVFSVCDWGILNVFVYFITEGVFTTPATVEQIKAKERGIEILELGKRVSELVSWCFQPSQPQRITSGLKKKG